MLSRVKLLLRVCVDLIVRESIGVQLTFPCNGLVYFHWCVVGRKVVINQSSLQTISTIYSEIPTTKIPDRYFPASTR
jgi:hypothetical protein